MPRVAIDGVTINDQDKGALPVLLTDSNGNPQVASAQAPPGATSAQPVAANAVATGAAAAIAATIAAAAGKFSYITGFEVSGLGATAAGVIVITVTGTQGGTLTFYFNVPAGVTLIADRLVVEFTSPIPSSAVNTAIAVNVPSFGAGNTAEAVNAHGFQQ